MSAPRVFLDPISGDALLNRRDVRHCRAAAYHARPPTFREILPTEAVLVEVGDALSKTNRVAAVDTELLGRAARSYGAHGDKIGGLTDGISSVVMRDRGPTDALTAAHRFRQAGFRPLLLDDA
ncbi:MAG TPA: hypothetical protein VFW96_20920 [Thermomicrobiales bacterium]|nr:hypothetical protein [Thermomicrobiales bacterium]